MQLMSTELTADRRGGVEAEFLFLFDVHESVHRDTTMKITVASHYTNYAIPALYRYMYTCVITVKRKSFNFDCLFIKHTSALDSLF
jgi:hypothetical protein